MTAGGAEGCSAERPRTGGLIHLLFDRTLVRSLNTVSLLHNNPLFITRTSHPAERETTRIVEKSSGTHRRLGLEETLNRPSVFTSSCCMPGSNPASIVFGSTRQCIRAQNDRHHDAFACLLLHSSWLKAIARFLGFRSLAVDFNDLAHCHKNRTFLEEPLLRISG